ncbi:MAG: hypothetical protein MUP97_02285 [Acidimicrobiia bacterium]|jgi:hypothetical protein|nr:hypothetical protein [Acidimicrobiia bacterium]
MLTRSRTAVSMVIAGALAATLSVGPSATAQTNRQTECGTHDGRGCAPRGERVDLATPVFTNSAVITNPLFPISDLHSALLLGHVEGKPFRTETTLLPQTETIQWQGKPIEVRLSQYMAYLDGRIAEVAIDRYAQADDGSVWYLGEDVFDYVDGSVGPTEGTWLAGRDGPPAMIMPGQPAVGDVYRPENAPNIVFEEVTVQAVGKTVDGPIGPVSGTIVVDELHQDGTHEKKIFAPGYGEFRNGDPSGDLEALALAVPTDALPGLPSPELGTLASGAVAILESARLENWPGATATIDRMETAWDSVQSSEQPPKPVATAVTRSLRTLRAAIGAHQGQKVAQAAVDLGQSALDLELRHRPPVEIDTVRFELWTQQLRVDAAAKDRAAVTGDVATLEWIRDRFIGTLDAAARSEIDHRLGELQAANDAGNLTAASDHAAELGARIRHLTQRQPVG